MSTYKTLEGSLPYFAPFCCGMLFALLQSLAMVVREVPAAPPSTPESGSGWLEFNGVAVQVRGSGFSRECTIHSS
jgi:hypothetical protein